MKPVIHLGVFGNPIEHSLSPRIHSLFAKAQQHPVEYRRYLSTPGQFSRNIAQFFRSGGKGLNVTLPFKQQAAELATELTKRAQEAGAVNTLVAMRNGQLLGDNTDGEGLIKDLEEKGYKVSERSLAVFGSGGSARGILPLLLQQQPRRIYLVNRTVDKALMLKSQLENLPPQLAEGASGYDLMYSDEPTLFMQQLSQAGCENVSDGLGMLVEQAASSYQLWMGGERPDTAFVMAHLRARS